MRKSYDLENPHSDDIEKGIKKTTGQYRIVRKAKRTSSKNSNSRRRSSSLSYYTPKSSSGVGYGQYVDIEKHNSRGSKGGLRGMNMGGMKMGGMNMKGMNMGEKMTRRKSLKLNKRKTRSTKF